MFRFLFSPIATIFSIIIFIRNLAFDLKILKITKVSKPVISIGNITTGGTGKTPIAILFANEAKKRGLKPGILSRGYKRKSSGSLVVHDGIKLLLSVTDSGDEPFLMANKLKNVPIIVDANRINGANRLIKDFGVDIVILDDGFQHRYLYRDIDLLLINASVKADMYQMLPLGMLRELPTSISRASKVLISKGSFDLVPKKISSYIKNPIMISEYLSADFNYKNIKKPFFAFCGIADPNTFINSLDSLNINIIGSYFLKDHVSYNKKDLYRLSNKISEHGIRDLITTEKDKLKLPKSFFHNYNIHILYIDLKIENDTIDELFNSII